MYIVAFVTLKSKIISSPNPQSFVSTVHIKSVERYDENVACFVAVSNEERFSVLYKDVLLYLETGNRSSPIVKSEFQSSD